MARRKRQRHTGGPDPGLLAQRELARGNFKQALKHAKACYRTRPDESSRCLLQRAYLARCQQLRQDRLLDQARACLQELVALGSPPADCAADIARLEVLLGVARTNRAADHGDRRWLEDDPRLLAALADQTLCCPDADVGAPRQLLDDAAAIRAAFEALETDALAKANSLLGTVARSSPLADWKLFARGLAAYYADDRPRMLANWSRLDAQRPARRIADALLALANQQQAEQLSAETRVVVTRLTQTLEQQPILTPLSKLVRAWREYAWADTLRCHRELVRNANHREPALVARVTDIIWRRIVEDEKRALVPEFVRYAPPPTVDPHWNRLRALLADETGDADEIQNHWWAYLEDITQEEIFTPEERPVAVALVCHHVAGELVKLAAAPSWADGAIEGQDRELQQCACHWFDRSLESDATLLPAAMDYARLLTDMGAAQRATEVYSDVCRNVPDAFDAWLALASHLTAQGEFDAAKRHAERALALRPRSPNTRSLMWTACIGLARQAALVGQFGLAYAELDEASAFQPEGRDAYLLDVHRAAVAYKEQNMDLAAQYLEQVLGHFDQPVAGLLVTASQVCRYRVGRVVRKSLNDRLQQAARGRPTSQSAGAMARYLHGMTMAGVEYFGLKAHRQVVYRHLRRCGRVRWVALELRDACRCVDGDPAQRRLLRKLVRQGRWSFPDDPHFYAFEGLMEIDRGPLRVNRRKARRCFEMALKLSKEGAGALDPDLQQRCSVGLSLVTPAPRHRTPFRPFDPFAGRSPDETDADGDPGGANAAGWDLDDLPDEGLDFDWSDLPPEMAALVRELSRELGLDPNELLRRIVAGEMPKLPRKGTRHGNTRKSRHGAKA